MALHSIYMKSGDGFVLVFSLTTMESLSELSSLREQILRLKEVDGYNAVIHVKPSEGFFCLNGFLPAEKCTACSGWKQE